MADPTLRGMPAEGDDLDTHAAPRANPRARRRRQLYLAGLVPLLVALAFSVKVGVMRDHDGDGTRAFDEADGATSLEEFTANRSLNWLEPWVAHFDTGNAGFLLTDYQRAIDHYYEALDAGVPAEHVCTVRINMALAQEKIGDNAASSGDGEGARNAWEDGIVVLDDGTCPTDAGQGEKQTRDAAAVKKRLEEKLKPPPPPPPNQQPKNNGKGEKQQPDKQKSQQQKKRDQLQRRNQRGGEERRKYEDLEDYDNYGYEYQW